MKKVLVSKPGDFHRLQLVDAPRPSPGPGEVLVRVDAIGVNFADCVVRLGLYPSAKKYGGYPITPGFEFAGVIEDPGGSASELPLGTRVFGVIRFGAYQEYVCVPADQLYPVPDVLSQAEAGGFCVTALTAYYALHELGALSSEKTVLVHSAAGGVGTALVQLARAAGARVIGVVGAAHKRSLVEQLGADQVIVRSEVGEGAGLISALRAASPQGYDIVCDANGYKSLRQSYSLLRPTGRLVIYGAHTMLTRGSGAVHWLRLAWAALRTPTFQPLKLTNENRSVLGFNLSYLFEEKGVLKNAMERLLEMLERGELKVATLQEYPLEDVVRAHQDLQSGTTTGKLVLRTSSAPEPSKSPE
ncbi:MAG: zinc-binding dehydrogenase [Polyangiaceae bacterium]|nr:zinc-binding dehydrogenase [Polyangiaceae bacterium]